MKPSAAVEFLYEHTLIYDGSLKALTSKLKRAGLFRFG
jgi:hypothetical protein